MRRSITARPPAAESRPPAAAAYRWLRAASLRPGLCQRALGAALLLGLVAALLAAAALARPWASRIDVGGLFDSPYLRDFHRVEYSETHQLDFRWSLPESALVLPGAGPLAPLELRLYGGDAEGMTIHLDTGSGPAPIDLRPGWQRIALLPRPDGWSGDVRVAIQAPRQVSEEDERIRGVALDSIALAGRAGMPPPGQAILLGLSTALAVLLAAWAARRVWSGALVGVALAIGSAAVLALDDGAWRLLLTAYSGRLLLVLLPGGLLALGIRWLLDRLAARGIISAAAQTRHALAAVALLAFLLRFGALAYPLNHNSDLPFILGRTWMVREGRLLTLFLPNPSLTPVQWEYDITIPRSPFYYIITTPVTYLPGRSGDELGMMAFSSAVDALSVICIAILILYAGGSGRAAAMGAFLAAVLPFALMIIVSWGVFPTLLAQCFSLLAMIIWLKVWPHLHQRWAQLLLAASLALAFLAYPTALVFLGTTGALFLLLLALRRDRAALPTLAAALLALVVVTLLYYGWHLPALITKSLPTVFGDVAGDTAGGETVFTLRRTLDGLWLQLYAKYGPLVLGLAAGGGLLLAVGRLSRRADYSRLLLLAWCLTYIPFALADEYVVTLILKQLMYILPALAILGGLLLGQLARRRRGAIVACTILALVCWQGLLLELDAIVHAFAQLK